MLRTNCSKCYFSNTVSSDKPCAFFIPDAIKSKKKLDIVNDFFYINNYICKYGVARDTVENKILKEHDIDIMEYAKYQASLKYILYIKITNQDFIETCNRIKSLSIIPQYVHIAFDVDYVFQQDVTKIAEEQFANCSFKWKLHKFIEDHPDYKQFYISVSTNNQLSQIKNIWIITDTILVDYLNNDSINTINYIMNIEQPGLGILNSSKSTEYLYGLFMTTENLRGLWNNVSNNLDAAIRSLYTDKDIELYD